MNGHGHDWRWKLSEVIERLRSRYQHIGRKTGAPFLAAVYPPAAQTAVLNEWRTQTRALHPEFELRSIDVLEITQGVVSDIGAGNIVDSLADPMPGSDPMSDLGHQWVDAVTQAVQSAFAECQELLAPKPVVSIEGLAALYPAAGPRDVMQALWDSDQVTLKGPVIVLIPGTLHGPRTYSFLDLRQEFMYRGDLL